MIDVNCFIVPDHPDTLVFMGAVAAIYRQQGQFQYDKAGDICLRVLEGVKQVFGSENPHTLLNMKDLVDIYLGLEDYNEAEDLQIQRAEISE